MSISLIIIMRLQGEALLLWGELTLKVRNSVTSFDFKKSFAN